jgi:hypothetical protein
MIFICLCHFLVLWFPWGKLLVLLNLHVLFLPRCGGVTGTHWL